MTDSTAHHCNMNAGVSVMGIVDVQRCTIEDTAPNVGIGVGPKGRLALQGSMVQRSSKIGVAILGTATIMNRSIDSNCSGVLVTGEATIADTAITGSTLDGIRVHKKDGSKAAVMIEGVVECSGNNTINRAGRGNFVAKAGGTFRKLPDHLILVQDR